MDQPRRKRLFGRRKGHALSPRQTRLIEELLPRLKFDPEVVRSESTWLEIGFGGGEHLIAVAEANPDVTVVGCEPFVNGVASLLGVVSDKGLANIRVHPDDVRDILHTISPGMLQRTFILFPDPWPKRRHVKRRLINASFLKQLAVAMAPGSELRVATDIGDYARTILVAVRTVPQFSWQAREACDWRERPHDWIETRYETKALAAGRRCYYFRFLRNAI